MSNLEVEIVELSSGEITDSLTLLEDELRGGERLTREGITVISSGIESGTFVVLAARAARDTGRIVGLATLSFRPSVSLGAEIASIEDIVVAKDFRRKGIGGKLLKEIEAVCRRREVFYLEVQAEEKSAVDFYAACGFEVEGARVMSVSYAFSSGGSGRNSITS